MEITDKEIVDILYKVYPKIFNNIVDTIENQEEL